MILGSLFLSKDVRVYTDTHTADGKALVTNSPVGVWYVSHSLFKRLCNKEIYVFSNLSVKYLDG